MSTWSQLFQYQALAEPVHVPAAAESVTLDKWESRVAQPLARVRRAIGTDGASIFEPTLAGEVVTLDKWFREIVQPTIRKRQSQEGDVTAPPEPSLFIVPPLGDWFQPISQPVIVPRRSQPTIGDRGVDATTFAVPPAVLVEWMQPMSLPVRPRFNAALFLPVMVQPTLPVARGGLIAEIDLLPGRECEIDLLPSRLSSIDVQ